MAQEPEEVETPEQEQDTDQEDTAGNSYIADMVERVRGNTPANSSNNRYINTKDFYPNQLQTETPDLKNQDYYPSPEAVQVTGIRGGGRYPELPLINSGQSLFPLGVISARQKALEASALQAEIMKQKAATNVVNSYKTKLGLPAYDERIDNDYIPKITQLYDDYMSKNGKNGLLSWPTSPEKQQADLLYSKYESLKNSTKMLGAAYLKQDEQRQKDSKFYDTPTSQHLNDFWAGNMSDDELLKAPHTLMTYASLDNKMKQLATSLNPDKIVNTYYQNGIPQTDKSGKPTGKTLYAKDGISFLNEVKRHGLDAGQKDSLLDLLQKSPDIQHDPNPDKDRAAIGKYVDTWFPNYIEQKMAEIRPDAATEKEREGKVEQDNFTNNVTDFAKMAINDNVPNSEDKVNESNGSAVTYMPSPQSWSETKPNYIPKMVGGKVQLGPDGKPIMVAAGKITQNVVGLLKGDDGKYYKVYDHNMLTPGTGANPNIPGSQFHASDIIKPQNEVRNFYTDIIAPNVKSQKELDLINKAYWARDPETAQKLGIPKPLGNTVTPSSNNDPLGIRPK